MRSNRKFRINIIFYLVILFYTISNAALDTLAVTPFKVIGSTENPDNYAYGLPETIANDFSHIPNITIVERLQLSKVLEEISLAQAGIVDEKNAQNIGQLAGAKVILAGTVHVLNNDVRANIRAIEVSSGEILYAAYAEYRVRELKHLFELGNILARKIARHLIPDTQEKLFNELGKSDIPDADAFKHYTQGIKDFDQGKMASGTMNFKKASEIDKNFEWAQRIRLRAQQAFDELDKEVKKLKDE